MHKITIEGVSNGWIVKVGCQMFVSEDKDKMLSEIGRYIDKPEEVEKEYRGKAKNQSNCPAVVQENQGVARNLRGGDVRCEQEAHGN